jgi:L-threonylcarbamoyladenylate synthase
VSPTTAAHVQAEFGPTLAVLDGGACEVGIESAIVDCTRGQPVLLRPGTLSHAQIEHACGERLLLPHQANGAAPRASGTLESHYAPEARVRMMDGQALQVALDLLGSDAKDIAVWSRRALRLPSRGVLHRRMPEDPATAARELFAVLREFDAAGVALIWIEPPPDDPAWAGVRDRLHRAAA